MWNIIKELYLTTLENNMFLAPPVIRRLGIFILSHQYHLEHACCLFIQVVKVLMDKGVLLIVGKVCEDFSLCFL